MRSDIFGIFTKRPILCTSLQFSTVQYLGELALLIDEGDDVHGLVGDHVQSLLVVGELDVLPVDVLQVVLLLLQLEHVAHKELLQVLVGKVDAQLLKAAARITNDEKCMLNTKIVMFCVFFSCGFVLL